MAWLFVHYLHSLSIITLLLAMHYLAHNMMYANTRKFVHSSLFSLNTHILGGLPFIIAYIIVFVDIVETRDSLLVQ